VQVGGLGLGEREAGRAGEPVRRIGQAGIPVGQLAGGDALVLVLGDLLARATIQGVQGPMVLLLGSWVAQDAPAP
jgi:hypothetical protein